MASLKGVPFYVPPVTVAALASYAVMGGLGYGLSRTRHKTLGSGVMLAAAIGATYAMSNVLAMNLAGVDENGKWRMNGPESLDDLDPSKVA